LRSSLLDVDKVELVEVGLESWESSLKHDELGFESGSSLSGSESTSPAGHAGHAADGVLEESGSGLIIPVTTVIGCAHGSTSWSVST
jgi:hypothetical protein